MIWINPVPNAGWYCDTTPVPAGIFFTQGVYIVATQKETQTTQTLEQAMQIGHDMVLAETVQNVTLPFRSFALDLPNDLQQVYAIDANNVITTGEFSLGNSIIAPSGGGPTVSISNLVGWCAMPAPG